VRPNIKDLKKASESTDPFEANLNMDPLKKFELEFQIE